MWLVSPIVATTPAPSPGPTCPYPRRSGPPVTLRMYTVDRESLDARLSAAFVQSRRDNATEQFLADATRHRCNASNLRLHRQDERSFMSAQRQGMSRTDASAAHLKVTLLLASTEQLGRVVGPALASAPPTTLLDIGAGRGEATAALASAIGGMLSCHSNRTRRGALLTRLGRVP